MADSTNPVAHPRPHPFLLVFAAAACLTGCGHDEPPPRAAVPVTVYEVDADPGRGEAVYSANVQPYTQVDLAFQAGGTIAEIAQVPGLGGELRRPGR